MYQATSALPDLDTPVEARMSGKIPVIAFDTVLTIHAPQGTRREQADWLAALAAKIDALSVTVRALDTDTVSV